MYRGIRSFISLAAVMGLAGFAHAATTQTSAHSDDGTYRTEIVSDFESCTALCAADGDTCRGTLADQADITIPKVICRLNDGTGANPAFPPTPPEPLDVDIAVADLNAYRAQYGLGPVTLNAKLNLASQVHADDLAQAGIISHTGTDGSSHGERIMRQGYHFTIAGENVATGQLSWDVVFKSWQDSPGHNENLLRDDVTEFGIALTYEPTTKHSTYWAMLVANPLPAEYKEGMIRIVTK